MDRVSPSVRSRNMSRIKSRNTRSTERRLRAILAAYGIRGWTLSGSRLPGKPDLVFQEQRVVVFADGCFWHFCPKCGHLPKSSESYWHPKLLRRRERDAANTATLQGAGWTVLRFWEHELAESPRSVIDVIRETLELE